MSITDLHQLDIIDFNRGAMRFLVDTPSLKDLSRQVNRKLVQQEPSTNKLVVKAAAFFECSVGELLCPTRDNWSCRRRWHVMRYLSKHQGMTNKQIGRVMTKGAKARDHGTVANGLQRHQEELESYQEYRKVWREFVAYMGG